MFYFIAIGTRYITRALFEIVYYVMRSKNEVLCAVRQTNQPKHIKPFLLQITLYYFFFKPS
jgi:hypothetical protein